MTQSSVRVRFAPSPTGHVHIGNIRAAIFNYLYARHEGGTFLLRVEDTDIERSTPEAIQTLLDVMTWLDLDYDEPIMYQTQQAPLHMQAAQKLIAQGDAYEASADGSADKVLYFRIPWDVTRFPDCVRKIGEITHELHPETPFKIDFTGVSYALMSRKGKPMPEKATLAGFTDLVLKDAEGKVLFTLQKSDYAEIAAGKVIEITGAAQAVFTRYDVFYHDLVKGDLAKPLDTIRDFIIIRSNGTPVFHLANVQDDITQNVTHIIRGDDHVENTYRHIFMFRCLGAEVPAYAHLPMIVNQQGKPYSKRDGDAFVGDFKTKGFLPDALCNYLTLLGWMPRNQVELMDRDTMIESFELDRVSSSPAKVDMAKLENLNAQYLAELTDEAFVEYAFEFGARLLHLTNAERPAFARVCALMRGRIRYGLQVEQWAYFFSGDYPVDEKKCEKVFAAEQVKAGLAALCRIVKNTPAPENPEAWNVCLRKAEHEVGLDEGKLNQATRLAVTGVGGGADLCETLTLLGAQCVLARLERVQTP